jgi:hypothetical protein
MKNILFLFLFLISAKIFAEVESTGVGIINVSKVNNVPKETLVIGADSYYDPKMDYSIFSGRVTDRDETASIVKVSSEDRNIKFFRASDKVQFRVQNSSKEQDYCEGYVRSIEEKYFVMFVKDLNPCFPGDNYFRRGMALVFKSDKLATRVREASVYRSSLIKKKKDYIGQLNTINQNVFSYEERKVQIASEFDRRISELEAQKIRDLDKLLTEKNDEVRLQRELAYRLDSLDKELNFYRIDKDELLVDRWHLDHDLGVPTYSRPEAIRNERANTTDF